MANTQNDLNVLFYIQGLPFINSTYEVARFGNTNKACLGAYTIGFNTTSIKDYYDGSVLTFCRGQDTCNIQIDIFNFFNNLLASPGVVPGVVLNSPNSFSEFAFIFDITGIPRTEAAHFGNQVNLIKLVK